MSRLSVLAALLVVAGCSAPGTDLTPAPAATTVGSQTAVDRVEGVEGVRMMAQSDAWPGLATVARQATPIRVTIDNGSRMPVRLRYSEFALVSPTGARYSALPPYGVEGSATDARLVETYSPVTSPAFTATGFRVAPYYSSVYPTYTPYSGTFGYDPYYYDRYATVYCDIELPTEEMVSRVLPEGVIDPGGRVEGFLYFERVPTSAPRVRFRADLVDADTGREFGEVTIPFVVGEM